MRLWKWPKARVLGVDQGDPTPTPTQQPWLLRNPSPLSQLWGSPKDVAREGEGVSLVTIGLWAGNSKTMQYLLPEWGMVLYRDHLSVTGNLQGRATL